MTEPRTTPAPRISDDIVEAVAVGFERRRHAEQLAQAAARRARRNHHIVQGVIMALSTLAIFLVDHFDGHGPRFAGNAIGLASQPFWLWSTWQARQWGMFVNALFYAGVWTGGVIRYYPGAFAA